MEPDVQPVKARRRIAPTLVAKTGSASDSPGFRPANPDEHSIFDAIQDGDALTDIDPAVINSKKRSRPSTDLMHPELPKRSRQVGGTASASPAALEPFYFFVVNPPRYWACAYGSVVGWLQKAVNNQILVSEVPFDLSESEKLTCLAPGNPCRQEWETLIRALADQNIISELWVKLTVVDKILTMFGEEEWHGKNLSFFSLQHHVWWVSHVQPWFSLSYIRSSRDYLQLAMSALVMELWWRMIWARHTQRLFLEKAPSPSSAAAPLGGAESASHCGMDFSIIEGDSSQEILDQSELGEGTDTESEMSLGDSTFEVDLPEDSILHNNDGMGKLDGFFSAHNKDRSHFKEAHDTGQDDEASNSDSVESSSSSGGFPRLVINGIVDETAYHTHDPNIKRDSTADWLSEIPPATALFFAHPRINDALDKIEKQYWVSERWDCSLAFEVLLHMTFERNSDLQLPEQSKALIATQMEYAYTRIFSPFLQAVGVTVSETERGNDPIDPLLEALPFTWSFNPTFGDYWVDTVLQCAFANLTTGGVVPAVHFIGLFPQLLLNADSRMDAQVSRITEHLHSKLVSQGTITPELEALVKTLDSLTAEKNTLLRQDKKQKQAFVQATQSKMATQSASDHQSQSEEMEDVDKPTDFDPNSLEGRLHAHRLQRIKQIDAMIEEVKLDFNRMTGAVDQMQSKRRRRTKTDLAMDMANFVSSPSTDSLAELPSDEAIWGLPSINPS
jgi:hypothetical protein